MKNIIGILMDEWIAAEGKGWTDGWMDEDGLMNE